MADIVTEVRNAQRDPLVKQKWQDYCSIFGNNQRDPSKHTESFLQGFLQGLNNIVSDNNNSIFVGGLPHDATETHMTQYFGQFGEVVKSKVMEGKGFGFVTFKSSEAVEAIIANYDGHSINGKAIECKKKTPPPAQGTVPVQQVVQVGAFGPVRGAIQTRLPQLGPYATTPQPVVTYQAPRPIRHGPATDGVVEGTEIFVGGLSAEITEQHLMQYFSQFGTVTKCELKHGKGYAFMGFDTEDAVETIVSTNGEHEICGRSVDCKKRVLDALQRAKAAGSFISVPGGPPIRPPTIQTGIQQQVIHRTIPLAQPQQFRKLNQVVLNIPKIANPEPGEIVAGKIFVGRVPHGAQEAHMIETFQVFGNITQIDLKSEKGFAFVHYDSAEAVQQVMANKDSILVGGQPVDCKPADNRPPKLAMMQQMGLIA